MLKELLDAIASLATRAEAPKVIPFDPRARLAFVDENKVLQFKNPELPPVREHVAFAIEDVVKVLIDAGKKRPGLNPEVWYNAEKITGFLGDADRDDKIDIVLNDSIPLGIIKKWAVNPGKYDQRQILRLLRVDFFGCLSKCGNLIDLLKSVRFTQSIDESSTMKLPGKSSMGKSMTAEFVGVDTLPDYITISVPMFREHVHTIQDIRCSLEPDERNSVFVISPLHGEVENAVALAEAKIKETIASFLPETIPLFYGTP